MKVEFRTAAAQMISYCFGLIESCNPRSLRSEQKKRFLKRIQTPEKNWKFTISDLTDRQFWDDYQRAYEEAFTHTSTPAAPWYVIPADRKWYTRLVVADIINQRLDALDLQYPTASKLHQQSLQEAQKALEDEDD